MSTQRGEVNMELTKSEVVGFEHLFTFVVVKDQCSSWKIGCWSSSKDRALFIFLFICSYLSVQCVIIVVESAIQVVAFHAAS